MHQQLLLLAHRQLLRRQSMRALLSASRRRQVYVLQLSTTYHFTLRCFWDVYM
jgi:hypothetical protein